MSYSLKKSLKFWVCHFAFIGVMGTAFLPAVMAQEAEEELPVNLTSKTLIYNDKTNVVTAKGDVEFTQGERIVRAQQVSYDMDTEIVKGVGEVAILEPNGDVHFADNVELSRDLADGFVEGLRSVLADGSRIWAEKGRRVAGNETIMEKARYTPCEPCKKDPDREPVWQLKAREVVHNKQEKTITYDDATFEVFGVPIAYTPYFSHPDGTVDRKSGFLSPGFSLTSAQGFGVESLYYYDIAPDLDATFGARVFTKQIPLFLGEVRKRFKDAYLQLNGGATYADRIDRESGTSRHVSEEFRGHLFGEGLWNLNEKWRTGVDLELTTDDQYTREYDITSKDVLENRLYVERFDERDYAAVRSLYFQDVRVSERQRDQPIILPEIEAEFLGDPNGLLGGRWRAGFSGLGLNRVDEGEETYRASLDLGWEGRYVLPIGLVNTFEVSGRGDVFYFDGRDNFDAGTEERFFPYAHWVTSMPLAKQFTNMQAVIEPKASLTLAPNLGEDGEEIPNEDSQDVQIDTANLFRPNRFPGYDRVEDISRVTYGVRAGLYDYNNNQLEVFMGQSYRFEEDDGLFVRGSGLENKESDYVGEVKARYGSNVDVNYRFQFEDEDFSARRHELTSTLRGGPVTLNTRYLFANSLAGTDIVEDREQINSNLHLKLNENWAIRTGAVYDFTQDNEGFRRTQLGLDYLGQCVTVSTLLQRNFTRDTTGENSTEFFVRVGLKNLGEIEG